MTEALIIAGPTASGKSAAALRIARAVGGEVVNADAMQVYAGLRILTARPSPDEEEAVPHHLFGHVDPSDRYSAGRYAEEAAAAIAEIYSRGRVPVIAGGTGLYLKALTEGLSEIPPVPSEAVIEAEAAWDAEPEAARCALLAADPAMAALDPADRQRHVRAASVLAATGKPLSEWQKIPGRPVLESFRAAVLCPPREALYDRIEARWDTMIEAGAVREAQALLARGLPPALPAMKTLGLPPLARHLAGEISLETASEAAKRDTRRFAKRQMTWFRGQTRWPWAETAGALRPAFGL